MSGFLSSCATKHGEHPRPCVQLQPPGHPGVWTAVVFRNMCLEALHLLLVVLQKVKFLHILQVIISCLLWFFMILPTAQPKKIKETSKSKSYPLHLPSVVEVVLVSTHLSVQPHNEGNPGLFEHPGSTGSWNHQIRKCLKNVFFHIFTDLIVIYADDSWS